MELSLQQREHRAKEAKRLLSEPLLAEALEIYRVNALQGLESVNATDVDKIRDLQAQAKVAQHIVDHFNAIITQSGEHDGGVSLK
ncbi:hypothetical protein JY97_00650 [Alkalispirochaeta odontotermitis]|nr:hypothetical protein JY97_00650 [Alkalispirochaeta odontotermitis]